MKNKFLYILILLKTIVSVSQIPNIEWQYYYGGNSFDTVYDQKQTLDGGYILIGSTNSTDIPNFHNNQEILILKINSLGILLWQKSIGGSFNESSSNIIVTSDNGYLISGYTSSNDFDFTLNNGNSDSFLMKLDQNGNILWQKTYGGSNFDNAMNVLETNDGGYILGGTSNSIDGDVLLNNGDNDFWLLKINNLGTILWQRNFGGNGYDSLNNLIKTSDGGYIMTGETYSTNLPSYHNAGDVLVIKTDSLGNLIWQKCFGGSNWDYGSKVIETSDGNLLIGGSTRSSNFDVTFNHGGFFDFWVFKINQNGILIWQKTYGGSNGEQLTSIIETNDGNYLACGLSNSIDGDLTINNGGNDFWILKVSPIGNLIWQKTLGIGTNEVANTILQNNDGDYLVSGGTDNAGISSSNVWVIKLSNEVLSNNENSILNNKISFYPNPVIDYLTIIYSELKEIRIYNLEGKLVKEFERQDRYSLIDLPNGMYSLEIITYNKQKVFIKIIK